MSPLKISAEAGIHSVGDNKHFKDLDSHFGGSDDVFPITTRSRLREGQGGGESFRSMKITINSVEQNFPAGTKLIDLVNRVREANRDNPVLKSLIEKTGKDHITFTHNRRVVKPSEYDSIDLKEGDEVRWMLPYAGGS
jgi:hypothetical protein